MYDLVPVTKLHVTSRYVSWTHGLPTAHHLSVHPSHPLHHHTTASKKFFSSALSLISQLSNVMFLTLHFFCLSPTHFPPLYYLFRKCYPSSLQKDPPRLDGALWHTLLSYSPHLQGTGGTRSLSTRPEPPYAQHCSNTGQNVSPDLSDYVPKGKHAQYCHTTLGITFRTPIALQEEVFIVSKPM